MSGNGLVAARSFVHDGCVCDLLVTHAAAESSDPSIYEDMAL